MFALMGRSAVSLESNGDILLQEDLMKAIKALPSQYHLVECVPVVGQPILIETTNASMINPWMINVKSISRVCSLVDTCTLQVKTYLNPLVLTVCASEYMCS